MLELLLILISRDELFEYDVPFTISPGMIAFAVRLRALALDHALAAAAEVQTKGSGTLLLILLAGAASGRSMSSRYDVGRNFENEQGERGFKEYGPRDSK